jgi:hypothetical protein
LKPGSAAAVLPGVHALALTLTLAWLQSPGPKELGLVAWGRDYQEALHAAHSSGRPLLILFDEVPGCSTCVHYGEVVLSDALLVEAAETLFVPLAIYNNQGGEDRRVLELFQEPAWNNPVVQFVAADGRRLIPRLAGDYSTSGLAAAMIARLANRPTSRAGVVGDLRRGPARPNPRPVAPNFAPWVVSGPARHASHARAG